MAEGERFEDFYAARFQAVYAFVHNDPRVEPGDVADIVEATFDVVRRKWRTKALEEMTAEQRRSWTFGVTKNEIQHHQRGKNRRRQLRDKLSTRRPNDHADPFHEVSAKELLEEALRVAGERSERSVRLVEMMIEEWPYAEMADELAISEEAARTAVSRMRAWLRQRGVGTDDWDDDE